MNILKIFGAILLVATTYSDAIAIAGKNTPPTAEEMECGSMLAPDRVPPMDYRTNRKMLGVVEEYHFPYNTENLIKPQFSTFGASLDYTLHAYPNHLRALVTLIRLSNKEKSDTPKGTKYTVDCYFRRAIRFVPDDVLVRMLYAHYLNEHGRRESSLSQLNYVESIIDDNPVTHHNLGLLFLEIGEYEKALSQCHLATNFGYTRTELQDKLKAIGRWREPELTKENSNTSTSTTSE